MNGRIATLAASAVAAVAAVVGISAASAASTACPASNPPNELVLAGGSGQTAQLGKQFPANMQAQLANSNGCPLTGNLAGVSVDFDAPGGGPGGIFAGSGSREAVVGTDAQGIATAPAFTANFTAGSYTVDAHSDYGSVEFNLTNSASGVPTAITATSGADQQATVNSQYAQPLQARVTDANGNPVQGVTVTFSILAGATGASASFLSAQASSATDSNGLAASPPLVANGTPGRFTAVASADGLSAVATFVLDNRAALVTIAPQTTRLVTTVGTRFRDRLQAEVLDSIRQPLEGVTVTFAISAARGGATASFLTGGTQVTALTDVDGVATSPALLANTTSGSFTATATLIGLREPAVYTLRTRASSPATITAGAASGEATPARSGFRVPLAVAVSDRYGNPVVGVTVVFAAARLGASGTFVLPRRRIRTDATMTRKRQPRAGRVVRVKTKSNGIAVAPRFTANRKPGGYIVIATVKGLHAKAAFALVNTPR